MYLGSFLSARTASLNLAVAIVLCLFENSLKAVHNDFEYFWLLHDKRATEDLKLEYQDLVYVWERRDLTTT